MVFKTTCVGSIPAILVIVNNFHLTKKKSAVNLPTTKASPLTHSTQKRAYYGGYTYRNSQQPAVVASTKEGTTVTLHNPYENTKQPHTKFRASTGVKKHHQSLWGWLRAAIKHSNSGNSGAPTTKNTTIGSLNTPTTLSSLQTRNHKLYRLASGAARNTHSRTKAQSYSRAYAVDSSTRYAMLLNKNTLLTNDAVQEPVGIKNFYNLDLSLLLEANSIFSISTKNVNMRPTQWLRNYKLVTLHTTSSTSTNPSADCTMNARAYTNRIEELLLNDNLSRPSDTSNPWRAYNPYNSYAHALNSSASYTDKMSTSEVAVKEQSYLNTLDSAPLSGNNGLLALDHWALESRFIRPKSVASRSAVFILAKAPTYRMGLMSEAPISTSQYYGNMYNKHILLPHPFAGGLTDQNKVTSLNPLLGKSTTSTSIMFLSKPYRNNLYRGMLALTANKIKHYGLKNLDNFYRSLLYTPSSVTHTLQTSKYQLKDAPVNTEHSTNSIRTSKPYLGLYKAINLKYKSVTRRPFKKNQLSTTAPTHKIVFADETRLVSKYKKNTWVKIIRTAHKKLNRFVKWKTKKATFFFTRFRKLNKARRGTLRSLRQPNYLFTKLNKYQSQSPIRMRGIVKLSKQLDQNYTPRSGSYTSVYQNQAISNTVSGLGVNFTSESLTHSQTFWFLLLNPILLKSSLFSANNAVVYKTSALFLQKHTSNTLIFLTNLVPHSSFQKHFTKKVLNSFANRLFREDIIPYYQNTLIRFIEFCTGRKVLFQFYPFVNQHIDKSYIVRYKRWLPRMNFYERRLGHKFFLEEALHIMHLSFILRDPKIIASWLKAIILRISFWKTRSIFRFLKYLFHNYFTYVFEDIKIKGLKIRLKGKISSAGNSRKRTILYRVGRTSHSEVNLRVVKDFSLINTFTGVMGFQVYLFY